MHINRRKLLLTIAILVVLGLAGAIGAAGFVYLGVYNVSALETHTQPVYSVLEVALRRSIRQRAEELVVPDLDQAGWQEAGLRLYERHCRQCHGAPGVGPDEFALGMSPLPVAIVETARKRPPEDIFWVIKHGVKMTGMPAWDHRLSEEEMWQITAFVMASPRFGTNEYQQRLQALGLDAPARPTGQGPPADIPEWRITNPAAVGRGRAVFNQYGCTRCHQIPGVTGARTLVGPALAGIADRTYIAGVLSNTHENMVWWLRFPQEVDPDTAMPHLGVRKEDALDMTAYLGTLSDGG